VGKERASTPPITVEKDQCVGSKERGSSVLAFGTVRSKSLEQGERVHLPRKGKKEKKVAQNLEQKTRTRSTGPEKSKKTEKEEGKGGYLAKEFWTQRVVSLAELVKRGKKGSTFPSTKCGSRRGGYKEAWREGGHRRLDGGKSKCFCNTRKFFSYASGRGKLLAGRSRGKGGVNPRVVVSIMLGEEKKFALGD